MTENKEIIQKLEKLQSLLDESYELSEYVEHGCVKEYGAKAAQVIKDADDLKGTPSIFSNMPSFPLDSDKYIELETDFNSRKKKQHIIAAITVVCLIIFFIGKWQLFSYISIVGIFALLFFSPACAQANKKYTDEKKKYDDSVTAYESSIKAFRSSLSAYETEKENGIAAAKEFAVKYKEANTEYNRLLQECVDKKTEAMETFVEKMKEVQTYDFVPSEYYHLVRPVIKLLKSGRADDYKEALNLAIQEEREAQAEAARRAEEAERTRIMQEQAEAEERRALEAQRHNQEMERQQQMHNKMMIEEQRAANKAAEKLAAQQAQAARNQADAERSRGWHMCHSCANYSKCPSTLKNSGNPNCGGYRPR